LIVREVRWQAAWPTFASAAARKLKPGEITGERAAEEVAVGVSCGRAMERA
jgi:hypothetical protein